MRMPLRVLPEMIFLPDLNSAYNVIRTTIDYNAVCRITERYCASYICTDTITINLGSNAAEELDTTRTVV